MSAAAANSTWRRTGGSAGGLRGQFADQAEGGRRERVAGLRDADDERDHARHSSFDEFDLGDERRQRRRVAEAGAEEDTPRINSGTLVPAARINTMEPASCAP